MADPITTFEQAADQAKEQLAVAETPKAPEVQEPTVEPEKKETAEAPEAAPGPAEKEAAEDSLLSAEDVKKIPPELLPAYKRLQADYTRKTQSVSEKRKALEAMEKVNQAYEKDPEGTLRLLAEQHGLEVTKRQAQGQPTVQPEKTLVEELREALGPDLDVLADKLAPVLDKIAKRAESQVDSRLKPIAEQQIAETAAKQAEAIMQTFQAKHSDFKRYEARMNELADKFLPSGNVSEGEYLDMLYHMASASEKAVVEALAANNKAAANSEPLPPGGVNPDKVAATMPKGLSFSDSFNAAFELAKQQTATR